MWTEPLDLEWSDAFNAADWIRDRLNPFGQDVGSVIPEGFAAYVAIKHSDGSDLLPAEAVVRLSEMVVEHTSTPDDVWFSIWAGYGSLHGGHAVGGDPSGLVPPHIRAGGRVRLPQRDYYLYRGKCDGATALLPWERPNLWWPEDRAWCVASELDLKVTYVGGADELAAAILAEPSLDVRSVSRDDRFEAGRDFA